MDLIAKYGIKRINVLVTDYLDREHFSAVLSQNTLRAFSGNVPLHNTRADTNEAHLCAEQINKTIEAVRRGDERSDECTLSCAELTFVSGARGGPMLTRTARHYTRRPTFIHCLHEWVINFYTSFYPAQRANSSIIREYQWNLIKHWLAVFFAPEKR